MNPVMICTLAYTNRKSASEKFFQDADFYFHFFREINTELSSGCFPEMLEVF